jgi:hypothetical protein
VQKWLKSVSPSGVSRQVVRDVRAKCLFWFSLDESRIRGARDVLLMCRVFKGFCMVDMAPNSSRQFQAESLPVVAVHLRTGSSAPPRRPELVHLVHFALMPQKPT